MMKKAWELGNAIYGMRDAIKWGKDFTFPEALGKRDEEDLGSLVQGKHYVSSDTLWSQRRS
jgi:hypothetical protein